MQAERPAADAQKKSSIAGQRNVKSPGVDLLILNYVPLLLLTGQREYEDASRVFVIVFETR